MPDLQDRTIIITGGSMGIGLAVARKCVSEGAQVIIAARGRKPMESALAELKELSGRNHLSFELDVSDMSRVGEFAGWCLNNVANIDGMVNCAGIYGPIGKIYNVDMTDFVRAVKINFLGTVFMCNAFVPLMQSGKCKKIVNYSGGGAASPFPRYSAYAASKAAIVRLTENLALELAEDGFDINCVAPGFVATRLHEQTMDVGPEAASDEFFEKTKAQMESGGVSPTVAADLTAFLLSDASDGISGKFIAAPYDPWTKKEFQDRLRNEPDLATLRRIDEKFFKKV